MDEKKPKPSDLELILQMPDRPPPPEAKSRWVSGLQLFVVPATIGAICVGIYLLFGFMTADTMSLQDLLHRVRTSGDHQRAVYAHEFVRRLEARRAESTPEAKAELRALVTPVIEAIQALPKDHLSEPDQSAKKILIHALGNIGETSAADYLETVADSDGDEVFRCEAMQALGAIKSRSSLSVLKKNLKASTGTLRKYAAFNLGAIGDPSIVPDLEDALKDELHEVRWNAAFSLAMFLKNAAGVDILKNMLDRAYLGQIVKDTDENREDLKAHAMAMAARALGNLKEASAKDILTRLSANDPDSRVRETCREVVNGFK